MKTQKEVILSNSFWTLLKERSEESRVIKIVWKSLRRLKMGRISSVRIKCTCAQPECDSFTWAEGRQVWPGSRIINEEIIGDHFTFREKKGMISYMPRGKEQEFTEGGEWALKGRQATSPGKWLRAMFSEAAIKRLKIKDNEFADLATAVKLSELSESLSFREVSFEEAYNSDNYSKAPDSCMWGSRVGPFYRAFGAVAVVCVDGNDQFRARAVVWRDAKIKTNNCVITLMDRIYYDAPEVLAAMCAYAASQGWHRKVNQSRGDNNFVAPDGTEESLRLRVKSPGGDVEESFYPYLDTFQNGDYNSVNNYAEGGYSYTSTGGDREEEDNHDGESEDIDGNWWSEDEVYEVDGEYYHQDDRRICYCNDGEYRMRDCCHKVDGEWYPEDEVVYSDSESRYLLVEDAVRVADEYYSSHSEKIVWCRELGEHMLCEEAVEIRGEWYPMEDAVEIDGERHLKEDCEEDDEGNWTVFRSHVGNTDGQVELPIGEVAQ
jgi:hypothetical protein